MSLCCQTLFYWFYYTVCFVLNFLGIVANSSDAQEILYSGIIHHQTHKNDQHSKIFKPWKLNQPLSSRRILGVIIRIRKTYPISCSMVVNRTTITISSNNIVWHSFCFVENELPYRLNLLWHYMLQDSALCIERQCMVQLKYGTLTCLLFFPQRSWALDQLL